MDELTGTARASRISIVDDDPSVARALARLCRSAGYRVHPYESAEAFLDGGGVEESDCLILDVHLPGSSGLELLARLSAEGWNVPTLFITAFDGEPERARALALGARAFLPKPLDSAELLDLLAEMLRPDAGGGEGEP